MEITRIGYQKALNSFLPKKYPFVERVEITRGPGIKMGMFICDLHLTTKEGFYKRMKDAADSAGYSSLEEFLNHIIEKELEKLESNQDDDKVADQLRGLGYIE